MNYVFCALIGYLIGGINPAYLIARIAGFDIRERGSGNAGASNATITMGKKVGVVCAIFDIFKACAAIYLAELLFPAFVYVREVTGVACILGHIFPVYMRFRGGKGLASLGGVVLMFDYRVFLILLAVEAVILLVTDYICMVPMTACVLFPVIYGIMSHRLIGTMILLSAAIPMEIRHIENIRRIRNGTELHFSYLWKGKKEIDRVSERIEQQSADEKKDENL